MRVPMRNPKTGEFKEVKVGWSWTLFFFSSVFGLPLFLRRLNVWGGMFLVLWAVYVITPRLMPPEEGALFLISSSLTLLGLQTFLGVKGNEMTAKNYLENGWVFIDPDGDVTRLAKRRWGISL